MCIFCGRAILPTSTAMPFPIILIPYQKRTSFWMALGSKPSKCSEKRRPYGSSLECLLRRTCGWKERFGNDADGSNLLCTAEVAAAILDRCGDATSANTIRERLSVFQDSFPHRNDRCDNINKE
mmetsp:Transcript_34071/g.57849  ORF Transcript_34071/g.57849 Transcript_34071/m.57849 type:complete len:124 (+) Transcript_34071:598-969(+)